jgi:putative heme-binding domain-containing protein
VGAATVCRGRPLAQRFTTAPQSERHIEMMLTDGKVQHFRAEEIEDYQASPNSIMPNGLEHNLTLSDLRNLVAFLESQK